MMWPDSGDGSRSSLSSDATTCASDSDPQILWASMLCYIEFYIVYSRQVVRLEKVCGGCEHLNV